MGSWGFGPFDNDMASDLIIGFLKPIEKALSPRGSSYDYDEARAAVQIIALAHGRDILGGANMLDALEVLKRMRADDEWISGWKSPRRLKAQLDREIKQVEAIIAKCESCREALKTYVPPSPAKRESNGRFVRAHRRRRRVPSARERAQVKRAAKAAR